MKSRPTVIITPTSSLDFLKKIVQVPVKISGNLFWLHQMKLFKLMSPNKMIKRKKMKLKEKLKKAMKTRARQKNLIIMQVKKEEMKKMDIKS